MASTRTGFPAPGASQMLIEDGTATSLTLLSGVRDWQNAPAWREFFRRYDALLTDWCGRLLDPAAADEVRQRVWIELAGRMRTFRYDPQKSFRGWLRELCRSRTVDFLRSRQRQLRNVQPLDEAAPSLAVDESDPAASNFEEAEPGDALLADLAAEAAAVQSAVRKRVKPRTWEVFWQIAIADRPIREVADGYGLSYAAAFEAYARVGRMLREEGAREMTNDEVRMTKE